MPYLWGEGLWGPGLWGAHDSVLTFDAITQYYMNLLIFQYITKTRAAATVGVFVGEVVASSLAISVRDGFDLV